MKKIILLIIVCCATAIATAQQTERFTFATSVGTGIDMNEPATTPFAWLALGYYAINKRLSVGIGTGLSIYEKTLIPLFADAKLLIIKPRKFTPYIECGVGYSFAPDKNANGGFYLNPSVGVEYSICKSKKLFLTLGYESQKLGRLKTQKQSLFTAEFAEKYLKQGTKMVVSGRIQTGSYTNRDGVKVYTTEVVIEEQDFAESKAAAAQNSSMGVPQPSAPQPSAAASDGFMNIPDGLEEELPFS